MCILSLLSRVNGVSGDSTYMEIGLPYYYEMCPRETDLTDEHTTMIDGTMLVGSGVW